MQKKNDHLSDQELLSFADGELKSNRAAEVSSHLEACWSCRARRTELENAIAGFVKVQREAFDPLIPPADGARALLKLRLAEAAKPKQQPGWQFSFPRWSMAYFAAVVAVIFVGSIGIWRYQRTRSADSLRTTELSARPNRSLTPGAVRPVSLAEICGGGDDKNRPVSPAVQKEVFKNYGIANARPQDYEVDYLITPELGGSDDIHNLWPEPFASTVWSAYVKDALEDRLHDLVCEQKLDLPTAQHDIATDWIGAYKKYFKTDKPILEHYGLKGSQDPLMQEKTPPSM
jgi:hypothetical protein